MISRNRGIVWNWRANDIRNCVGANFSKGRGGEGERKEWVRFNLVRCALTIHRWFEGWAGTSFAFIRVTFCSRVSVTNGYCNRRKRICTRKSSFHRDIQPAKFNSSPPGRWIGVAEETFFLLANGKSIAWKGKREGEGGRRRDRDERGGGRGERWKEIE